MVDEVVFFDAIVVKNIFSDVDASYVRNFIKFGAWNFPKYRGPRWCTSLGRSSPATTAYEAGHSIRIKDLTRT
jgi:hypothetical protein